MPYWHTSREGVNWEPIWKLWPLEFDVNPGTGFIQYSRSPIDKSMFYGMKKAESLGLVVNCVGLNKVVFEIDVFYSSKCFMK